MTQVGDAAAETQGAPEGAPESGGQPDFGPLLERMNEFGSQLGEISQRVAAPQEPQQPQEQFAGQPFGQQPFAGQPYGQDPYGGQQFEDEFGNPVDQYGNPLGQQQQDPEAAKRQLAEMLGLDGIQSQAQQAAEAVQRMTAERNAETLKAKYPDFADPEKVGQITEAVQQRALNVAGGDQALAAQLMGRSDFWEMTYLAGRASDSAASETPAGGADAIQLESPGGATPEQAGLDEGDLIVQAMERRKPAW